MKKQLLLILALSAGSAIAQEHHHHEHLNPMQEAYQNSMVEMHEGMEASLQYDDPDQAFAAGMIAHHQGAIEMAKIQLEYGKDPVLRQLAEEIIEAQEGEIALMQEWLENSENQ